MRQEKIKIEKKWWICDEEKKDLRDEKGNLRRTIQRKRERTERGNKKKRRVREREEKREK